MFQAASIIFIVGMGILMSNLFYDRSGSKLALTKNLINPTYQNVVNTALENYKSGVQ